MDFKVLIATFGLVFLAELGDKTQLATLLLSADNKSKISVFAGSAIALVLCSLLAVILGAGLSKWIPQHLIKLSAGILFIAFGVWTLISVLGKGGLGG
jgi:putative Ca2+/H+ antiporter (TMEM165/GDT1 family)